MHRLTYKFKETNSSTGILETLANTKGFEFLENRQAEHWTELSSLRAMKLLSELESDARGFRVDQGPDGAYYVVHPKVQELIEQGMAPALAIENVWHPCYA